MQFLQNVSTAISSIDVGVIDSEVRDALTEIGENRRSP
jgi:hypothetical protein